MSYRFASATTDAITTGAVDICNGTGPYSVYMYVYVNSSASAARGGVSVKGSTNGQSYFGFNATSANLFKFGFKDTAALFPECSWTSGFTAGSWHTLCGTYDGTTGTAAQKLYADGSPTPVATNTPTSLRVALSGTIESKLGNSSGAVSESWDGLIAEVAIYNRALTAQEVMLLTRLVSPFSPTSFPGLINYWPLINDATNYVSGVATTIVGSPSADSRHPSIFKNLQSILRKRNASGTLYPQALTATLNFVGANSNTTKKVTSGALSFVGAQNRFTSHTLPAAALNFSGTTNKLSTRFLTGALSFVGNFSPSHLFVVALTATLNFVGSIAKTTKKSLTGSLSFSGAISKFISHGLTGSLNFIGSTVKQTSRALTGSVGFVGSLLKRCGKALTGSLGFSGAISKRTAKALTAALNFSGAIAKQTSKAVAATLSFLGNLVTVYIPAGGGILYTLALTATLSFSGAIGKMAAKSFTATLGTVGSGIGKDVLIVLDSARTRIAKRISNFVYQLLD